MLTQQAEQLMRKHYMLPHEQNPEEAFYRAAHAYHDDKELGDRIFDYVMKGWMMFASPVLSNAPCKKTGEWNKGLPISCFLSYVPDTLEGLIDHTSETRWLSVKGGGVGGHWSDVRAASGIAPGPIPFIHTVDADMVAYKQGRTRKGSYAAYMDVSHPDILEFLQFRTPTGGDINRKCFNLHHAVMLSDAFMSAVLGDKVWPLVDPKTGEKRAEIAARELWERILETRGRTGEPYLYFSDTADAGLPQEMKDAGLKLHGSNLCVHGDTNILTDTGYQKISSLEGERVKVWNGEEFSEVTVMKTGSDQEMIGISFSNGESLVCTPYHKFYLHDGVVVSAKDLEEGSKLLKCAYPVVSHGDNILENAYEQGFFQGDGCIVNGKCRVYLYGEKKKLLSIFREDSITSAIIQQKVQDRICFNYDLLPLKDFVPDSSYTINSRLQWFAGLCDADGCIYRNGANEQLVLASIDFNFLLNVKRMLDELGCQGKISLFNKAGLRSLPSNDGTGGTKDYYCQDAYRLIITSIDLQHLIGLGLGEHLRRLTVKKRVPQRDARRFVTVVSNTGEVVEAGDTYCFTEPKRHMGVFNGILAGQCNEIFLPTDENRTAVCCLSSANAEHFDEWKDSRMVADLTLYLNHVLQFFIDNAPDVMSKAVYSAKTERSIGIGMLGLHSYLQKHMLPFESPMAVGASRFITKTIKEQAVKESKRLKDQFPNEYMKDRANCHLMAIAPNANSGILAGSSPSIEPWLNNAYMHRTRVGSHMVRNKYLEEVLEKCGKNDDETWHSIMSNNGSVQHLDFLSENEKDVFKTAYEIDQRWIIEHASVRQEFVCQGQSINLFFNEGTSRAYVNAVHLAAWKKGLKGLYYMRMDTARKAEAVSNKVDRVALKDYDECMSCQG